MSKFSATKKHFAKMKFARYYLITLLLLAGCSKASQTENLPAIAIVGWGDSLTAGKGGSGTTYLTDLEKLTDITTFNKGIRSETSTEIKDRLIAGTQYLRYPTIIWAGRNNAADYETVEKDIATMVAALGHTHYIILGIINSNSPGEHKGKPKYNIIINLNKQLAETYGDHFIDIRAYLVSKYDPSSAEDLQNYKDDVIPQSLRSDELHLTKHGYQLVAEKINQHIDLLIEK